MEWPLDGRRYSGRIDEGFSPAAVAQSTELLRRRWVAFLPRPAHLVPDAALSEVLLSGVDFGRTISLALITSNPGSALVLTRALLEATAEALFLTAWEGDEYDRLGCLARAAHVNERARIARSEGRLLSAAALIDQEAERWDAVAHGQGALLREAHEEVSAQRKAGRFTWHGLSRSALMREVDRLYDSQLSEHYSVLSVRSHPSATMEATTLKGAIESPVDDEYVGWYLGGEGIYPSLVAMQCLRGLRVALSLARSGDGGTVGVGWSLKEVIPWQKAAGKLLMGLMMGTSGAPNHELWRSFESV